MSKDYKTVDARTIELNGIELVKAISRLCDQKISKAPIWTKEAIPSKLIITPEQFKIFASLQEEPSAKPTGKEVFKTGEGYIMEIEVEEK